MENYLKEKNNANIAKRRPIIHRSVGALANTVEDQDIKKNSADSKIRKAIPLIEQSKQMKRGKTKKINKKPEKKATEKGDSRRESEEDSEEETSEEDSPKKPIYSSRAFRVGLKTSVYANLNEKLGN